MSKRSFIFILVLFFSQLVIAGCIPSSMSVGNQQAKTVATGSAAGDNSQNAVVSLEKCTAPLGTMAIYEEQTEPWFYQLTNDYRLPSTVPVIRLLAQQSGCFVVLERGKAMNQMMRERELMQSGEMRSGSNFGKGQMVAADYTVSPSITFSSSDTGGAGAIVGALFGSVAGALAGGIQTSDASTVLTMIENRSGVQLAAAEGSARSTDYKLFGGLLGGSAGGAAGAYTKTPQGKVLVAAFTDSMNNLISALRSYRAQNVAGGLGTGGSLGVQGAVKVDPGATLGVMTDRELDPATGNYTYVVVSRDKSRTFNFTSARKITYKNDLIQFYLEDNQIDENSIKLIERRYVQKYWQ